MGVDEDILKAQEIVNGTYRCNASIFNDFSRIYRGTNEMISHKSYYELLKNRRKVLSVTASGDQILNAIFMGAQEVTGIDISRFAKYYTELKIAAIKVLTKEEYLLFFTGRIDTELLAYDTYEKLRKYLDNDTLNFWDSIYNYFDEVEINESNLFSKEVMNRIIMENNNLYLQEDNYYLLRKKIDDVNINYVNHSIYNYKDKDGYDLIILSNIIEYCKNKVDYKWFLEGLPLNENGICITYIFLYTIICNDSFRFMFHQPNYEIIDIDKEYCKNAILVYKK